MALRAFGAGASAWVGDYVAALKKQYKTLGLLEPVVATDTCHPYDDPELLVFFGDVPWPAPAVLEAALETYAAGVTRLLPVVDEPAHAMTHLPTSLRPFNAFLRSRLAARWPEALVDEVLALTWQRRRARRIFISYRRVESEAIAHQLYRRYSDLGYDVFLDDFEIQRAERFQDELQRRLDDADAVLVLWSPKLDESEWVRREIDLATTCRVGLLGVLWPEDRFPPVQRGTLRPYEQIPLDCRFRLTDLHFEAAPQGVILHKDALLDIDHLLFTQRSVAVASRIRELIVEARAELEKDYVVVSVDHDTLDLTRGPNGPAWVGRVLPFRPEAHDLMELWSKAMARTSPPEGIVAIYPEVDPRDARTLALREMVTAWGATVRPRFELRTVRV